MSRFIGLTPGIMVSLATLKWLGGLIGNRRGLRTGKQRHELKRGLRYDASSGRINSIWNQILTLKNQECGSYFDLLYGIIQWNYPVQGLWTIDLWGGGSPSTCEDYLQQHAIPGIPRRCSRSSERSKWSGQAASCNWKDEMGILPIDIYILWDWRKFSDLTFWLTFNTNI